MKKYILPNLIPEVLTVHHWLLFFLIVYLVKWADICRLQPSLSLEKIENQSPDLYDLTLKAIL